MINRKTQERIGSFAKALCALSLVTACAPAWADSNRPKYEMAVFSDAEQGNKILSGRYDQAIDKINAKSRDRDDLYVQTNLCVAYTKAGELEAAELACEEAVVAVKSLAKFRSSSFAGTSPAQIRARYMAIVLSNRGVLKAVKGDLEAARADFDAALAQRSRVATIQTNMEQLSIAEEAA